MSVVLDIDYHRLPDRAPPPSKAKTINNLPIELLSEGLYPFIPGSNLFTVCKEWHDSFKKISIQHRDISLLIGRSDDFKTFKQSLVPILRWLNPQKLEQIKHASCKSTDLQTLFDLIEAILTSEPPLLEQPPGQARTRLERYHHLPPITKIGIPSMLSIVLSMAGTIAKVVSSGVTQIAPSDDTSSFLIKAHNRTELESVIRRKLHCFPPSELDYYHCKPSRNASFDCTFAECTLYNPRDTQIGTIILIVAAVVFALVLVQVMSTRKLKKDAARHQKIQTDQPDLSAQYRQLAERANTLFQDKLRGIIPLPPLPPLDAGVSRPLADWFKKAFAEAKKHEDNERWFNRSYARIEVIDN